MTPEQRKFFCATVRRATGLRISQCADTWVSPPRTEVRPNIIEEIAKCEETIAYKIHYPDFGGKPANVVMIYNRKDLPARRGRNAECGWYTKIGGRDEDRRDRRRKRDRLNIHKTGRRGWGYIVDAQRYIMTAVRARKTVLKVLKENPNYSIQVGRRTCTGDDGKHWVEFPKTGRCQNSLYKWLFKE